MLKGVRQLSKHSAIYGVGDVAIQALNFLLLLVYVRCRREPASISR